MEKRSLRFISQAVGGEIQGGKPEALPEDVCLDSRKTSPGSLFVAIAGEHFDGHNYLAQCFAAGAGAALVERSRVEGMRISGPLVVVEDTRRGLGRLASRYREDFAFPRIAVAGSNGKTTTKNLIAAVLEERFPTLSSESSFNNDIGVPITLLKLEQRHRAAVLEAGTNHPGELRPLLQIIAPHYGVLTSIGPEHLEFFRDLAGVVAEEGVIAEELPPEGMLFINIETAEARSVIGRGRASIRTIGFQPGADWRVTGANATTEGMTFSVSGNGDLAGSYSTCLIGMHQVLNATMAIAVGSELGLGRAEIQRGLSKCRPAKMRLQLIRAGSLTILDDTYNANEDSMKSALDTLAAYPQAGRRVAILGSMGELGSAAEQAHLRVGMHAAKSGVQMLVALGPHRERLAEGARRSGLDSVEQFESVEMLIPIVGRIVKSEDVALVKASRFAKLERVVEALVTIFT